MLRTWCWGPQQIPSLFKDNHDHLHKTCAKITFLSILVVQWDGANGLHFSLRIDRPSMVTGGGTSTSLSGVTIPGKWDPLVWVLSLVHKRIKITLEVCLKTALLALKGKIILPILLANLQESQLFLIGSSLTK